MSNKPDVCDPCGSPHVLPYTYTNPERGLTIRLCAKCERTRDINGFTQREYLDRGAELSADDWEEVADLIDQCTTVADWAAPYTLIVRDQVMYMLNQACNQARDRERSARGVRP